MSWTRTARCRVRGSRRRSPRSDFDSQAPRDAPGLPLRAIASRSAARPWRSILEVLFSRDGPPDARRDRLVTRLGDGLLLRGLHEGIFTGLVDPDGLNVLRTSPSPWVRATLEHGSEGEFVVVWVGVLSADGGGVFGEKARQLTCGVHGEDREFFGVG